MQPGQNLLHYQLVERIGEGGMGVVWRARDTALDREVALKTLPEAFARDQDRLLRFEREAKLLASLDHPNIATVHGLHHVPAEGSRPEVRFLAMEMVPGEDLAARLRRGRLPVEDVIAVGVQIAAALEAAHSRGVVHRDLKPANVVVRPDGKVKVLDFGLAKVVEADAASLSLSPTVTARATEAGVIMGTAAYMSPEQARGRQVDRRADLWSFGCILYECLTGVRLFQGESVSDSLAATLRDEPDWSLLPGDTPPLLRMLVRRCLVRDPERRLQDAGDARVDLELARDPSSLGWIPSFATAEPTKPRLSWLPWLLTATAVAAAALLALRGAADPAEPAISRRLTIPVPGTIDEAPLAQAPPVISPDGRNVVFGVIDEDGTRQLYLRAIDDFEARPLSGARGAAFPFWSPDGREIAFFDAARLRRLEIATGRIQTIGAPSSSSPRGGTWNERGQILFAPNANSGIQLFDPEVDTVRQVTTPDPTVPDSSHRWPQFLPDGTHFLFVAWTNDPQSRQEHSGVFVGSITGEEEPTKILDASSNALYVPPGHLLSVREGVLSAIPFDPASRRITGEETPVARGILQSPTSGYATFSASREDSTLIYYRGQLSQPARLVWYDRAGNATPVPGEPADYSALRLAPTPDRAAAAIRGENGDSQIWTIDLRRGVRTRLTSTSWSNTDPVWSGDGERILYTSQQLGTFDFESRFADGSGGSATVLADERDKLLYDWSRDGRHIAYFPTSDSSGRPDIWIFSPESGTSEPLVRGEPAFQDARFSPDGRFVAYESDESGRTEVFVQELAEAGTGGARWQLSTSGGRDPMWGDDNRELLYLAPRNHVMAVPLEIESDRLVPGAPQQLFQILQDVLAIDATRDHRRLLVAVRDKAENEPISVILNWTGDLE